MPSISQLLFTEVTLPTDHPRAGQTCPVFGHVIHHPEGPVLVDSGVGQGHADIDGLFASRHHTVEEVLADIGVSVRDIAMVINSHLHFDHCGNNLLFPAIPLVAQRSEYEAARQPGYTVPEWIDFPDAHWVLVDGNADVLPGVSVMPTPGHTPGHQSVVVAEGGHVDVIAAQAVYDVDELKAEASIEPLSPADAAATTRSAQAIKALHPQRVLFSHDPRVWRSEPLTLPA